MHSMSCLVPRCDTRYRTIIAISAGSFRYWFFCVLLSIDPSTLCIECSSSFSSNDKSIRGEHQTQNIKRAIFQFIIVSPLERLIETSRSSFPFSSSFNIPLHWNSNSLTSWLSNLFFLLIFRWKYRWKILFATIHSENKINVI